MEIKVIQDRLEQYKCSTPIEEENAIKEIMQEIALLSLSRQGFFSIAEFHGGTALRILYNLQRFSEDLDFALLSPNKTFEFSSYLNGIMEEFETFGFSVKVQDRSKADSAIKKAFLKDRSIGKILELKFPVHDRNQKTLKIKIETISWKEAKSDVARFLKPVELESLDNWNKDFFLNQTSQLEVAK